MKKDSKNTITNEKISDKLEQLQLLQEVEISHIQLKILNSKVKLYMYKEILLEENKPFWFQKKKLKEYHQELEDINNVINKCFSDMGEEVDLIYQVESQLCDIKD